MSGIRGLHLPTGFRVHLSFAKFRNAPRRDEGKSRRVKSSRKPSHRGETRKHTGLNVNSSEIGVVLETK